MLDHVLDELLLAHLKTVPALAAIIPIPWLPTSSTCWVKTGRMAKSAPLKNDIEHASRGRWIEPECEALQVG